MEAFIYCVVDATGHVYVSGATDTADDVTAALGLDPGNCDIYRYDLAARRAAAVRVNPARAAAAEAAIDREVGTPDRLMRLAEQGTLSKMILAELLDLESRPAFLAACSAIERRYTEECAARQDPCLESGCSMNEAGREICLQPLLRAGAEYHRACAAEWIKVFRVPQNRIDDWRVDRAAWQHGASPAAA